MHNDGYCGMACTELMEDLDEILKHCIVHSDYDPEFAPVMVQRLIDRCNEVKTELMCKLLETKITQQQ